MWRYKVGDFQLPVEKALGIRPKIVTADGVEKRLHRIGWLERWRAKRQVASIRKAVETANRSHVKWADAGGVVYAEQSQGFEALRAYAKWLDCRERFSEFVTPPEGDYYKHPAFVAEIDSPSCPHLVGHDCYNGYFLPCEFDSLAEVEPYLIFGHWPASRSVGSSQKLVRELAAVQAELQVPEKYEYPVDDPLLPVRTAYLQLLEIAELSCRHGLPVIFWG